MALENSFEVEMSERVVDMLRAGFEGNSNIPVDKQIALLKDLAQVFLNHHLAIEGAMFGGCQSGCHESLYIKSIQAVSIMPAASPHKQ